MKTIHWLTAAALAAPLAALAEGDSPWLPIPGQLLLGVNYTEQSGDGSYIGSRFTPISGVTMGGASKYRRKSTQLRAYYGISDSLALDASIGYGEVKVGRADNDRGQTDTTIGLSWRVLDEFENPSVPTLTLRAAAIVNGSYDGGRLAALGNDANGYELAALIGKELTPAIAVWAELGVQDRDRGVPNARFYDLGVRWRVGGGVSLSAGYGDQRYSGNLDIGGPGFSPARFQQVRAERSTARIGAGWAFAGNQGVSLTLGKFVGSGRNTVKDDQIATVSYTFGF